MRREIAVVTGTRDEYGILKPLLEKARDSNSLRLKLIVTGMHLLKKYGLTINEIKEDGFKVDAEVPMYEESETDNAYHGKALAMGINNFSDILLQMKPDILVVFGDRLEPLAATLAAASLRIPIAHIHGGDKTDSGHIDESIRYSVTKFAHIHFPPTGECRDRLIKMGEEPWRVYKVGALGLDSVVNHDPIPREKLLARLGLNHYKPFIVCIFHPVHLEKETAGEQMHEILEALKELKIQTVAIYPNNDAGSEDIIAEIEKYRGLSFIKFFPTLSHSDDVSLLKHTDVLVGNSSSGIIEAPSLRLPVVNIGSRNVGREHAENVTFVKPIKKQTIKAIQMALYDEEHREKVKQCDNPWGDGRASYRILKVLSEIRIDKKLLQKKITY